MDCNLGQVGEYIHDGGEEVANVRQETLVGDLTIAAASNDLRELGLQQLVDQAVLALPELDGLEEVVESTVHH
jgi:hypothetical protein